MPSSPIKTSGTLRIKRQKVDLHDLCYVPVNGRYILYERDSEGWRQVPLLSSESAAVVLGTKV